MSSTTNYGAMSNATDKATSGTKPEEAKGSILPIIIAPISMLTIGTGIAYGIYAVSATTVDPRIAAVGDTKWAFASAVALGTCTRVLNFIPTFWKSRALESANVDETDAIAKKNKKANPYVFQNGVVFETAGAAGSYNRANRSLQHMVENSAVFLASLYMASTIFPIATFYLTLLYGGARIWHMLGYANQGYGGHAMGFVLSSLAMVIVEGFCLIVAIKA